MRNISRYLLLLNEVRSKKQNKKQRKKINGSHHAIITGTRKRESGEEGKLLRKSNLGELANKIMFRISRQTDFMRKKNDGNEDNHDKKPNGLKKVLKKAPLSQHNR